MTGFVTMKIREWKDIGRQLKDLAAAAPGMAGSVPSQVLAGKMGVGARSAPRFAKALGYRDVGAMKAAAYEWWSKEGKAGAEAVDTPLTAAQGEAVDAVVTLNLATKEQLRTIMAAFTHPRFHDRDRQWWIDTLLEELRRDRRALEADRVLRGDVREGQKAIRGVKRQHDRAAEAAKKTPKGSRKAG